MRNYSITIGEYEPAYYELVRETYSFNDCISEFIDNSIDSNSKNINVTLFEDSDGVFVLRIEDDGDGMSTRGMIDVFNKFISISDKGKDSIGCRGVGLKCAILALSSKPHSTCVIRTSRSCDNTLSRLVWNVEIDNGVFNKARVEESVKTTRSSGTVITLTNARRGDLSELHEFISSRYSYIALKKKVVITLNGERINFFDRMHFSLISRRLNNDGAYYIDNKCFYVHTGSCGDKFIFLYVPVRDKKGNRINKDEVSTRYGGLYAIKGGRYINYASNIRDMIGAGGKVNGGGAGRLRLLVMIDDSNSAKFGVRQNKSSGITPIKDCLSPEDFSKIKLIYKKMYGIHKEVGRGNYGLLSQPELSSYIERGIKLSDKQLGEIKELANTTETGSEIIKRICDKEVKIKYASCDDKSRVFSIVESRNNVTLEINKNSLYYEFMARYMNDNGSQTRNKSIEANVLYYYNRFLGLALKNNDKVGYASIFNKLLKSFGLPCSYTQKF